MLCIIGVVAFLTQSSEVAWVAIFGRMVKVSNRKDYPRLFTRLGVEPHSVVPHSVELASVMGAFKYGGSYLLPILRIAVAVFGSYRHIIHPP